MRPPLELEYEWVIKPDSDPALEHYVLHFRGEAKAWDDEAGEEVVIGSIIGHRIDLAQARFDAVNIAELLDSISPDIADFRATVFHDNVCYLPGEHADSNRPRPRCDGLVFIDEVMVREDHRGLGIGTELLRRLSETIDLENCILGLKAFPISQAYGEARRPEEIERVKYFYAKLGFGHAGKDFMVKDANRCGAMLKRTAIRRRDSSIGARA